MQISRSIQSPAGDIEGINIIQLMMQERTDQRWLTYKQAEAAGAQVLKGEKGTSIQYWKFSEEQTITDEAGRPVLDDQGQTPESAIAFGTAEGVLCNRLQCRTDRRSAST